jgi:hypothetical protein
MPENPHEPPSDVIPPEPKDVETDELDRLGQRSDEAADEE